jgi:monooxygenase
MPEEHVDVLIVGAGLSGIGAACHLRRECPGKTFAILEARDAIGGTWDLFRYPGIRSDSDMFTLGYAFKPWTQAKAIADGDSIRDYVRETAREYGVDRAVRFGHRVVRAEWSSERAAWTVEAVRADTGKTVRMTCSLLFACSGYYRYEQGYTPEFDGVADFAGPVVHPQHWPDDLDYRGKRVLVIGSGATAVTLVPAMAGTASHVTMLQRSPSYVVALPSVDPAAERLRRLLPTKAAYSVLRWRNMLRMLLLFQLSRHAPDLVKRLIRKGLKAQLPPGYDVDTHFSPRYNPWDQRMCFVPDGDLLRAIRKGRASVVTDQIDRFTRSGVRLASGAELEADIIVTATGLDLVPMGGVTLSVDGADVQFARTVAYKGMMLSGVPNFVYTLGYTNASWTLKSDLVARYVCRLLRHMDARGHRVATPKAPASTAVEPFIDLQSGYIKRVIDQMPKQGTSAPWRLHQNYPRDVLLLRHGPVDDEGIEFGRARAPRTADAPAA